MKVIFLDMDGVMNSCLEIDQLIKQNSHHSVDMPQPWRLKLLKKICDETGAKVVLSSSWRCRYKLEADGKMHAIEQKDGKHYSIDALPKVFEEYGIEWVGKTPWAVKRADYREFQHYDEIGPYGNPCYADQTLLYDRGAEILEWLRHHPEVTDYVAIDDDTEDIKLYTDKFVHTGVQGGLRTEEANLAIAILNRMDNIIELKEIADKRRAQTKEDWANGCIDYSKEIGQ